MGFPGSSAGKDSTYNTRDHGSISGLGSWKRDRLPIPVFLGFPGGSDGKESACNVGDLGSIPGLGRSLEEGMATHSSILACRTPVARGAWRAAVHGVSNNRTQLSDSAQHSVIYVNATFSVGPTLAFPHCVHKSVLCICISVPSLQIGSSVLFS